MIGIALTGISPSAPTAHKAALVQLRLTVNHRFYLFFTSHRKDLPWDCSALSWKNLDLVPLLPRRSRTFTRSLSEVEGLHQQLSASQIPQTRPELELIVPLHRATWSKLGSSGEIADLLKWRKGDVHQAGYYVVDTDHF